VLATELLTDDGMMVASSCEGVYGSPVTASIYTVENVFAAILAAGRIMNAYIRLPFGSVWISALTGVNADEGKSSLRYASAEVKGMIPVSFWAARRAGERVRPEVPLVGMGVEAPVGPVGKGVRTGEPEAGGVPVTSV
jgi:hypothetical protein